VIIILRHERVELLTKRNIFYPQNTANRGLNDQYQLLTWMLLMLWSAKFFFCIGTCERKHDKEFVLYFLANIVWKIWPKFCSEVVRTWVSTWATIVPGKPCLKFIKGDCCSF